MPPACGFKHPDQGLNSSTRQWEHGILTTGTPGNSLVISFVYGSVYMSIANSKFIPPPNIFPFDNSKFVFQVCESAFAL